MHTDEEQCGGDLRAGQTRPRKLCSAVAYGLYSCCITRKTTEMPKATTKRRLGSSINAGTPTNNTRRVCE